MITYKAEGKHIFRTPPPNVTYPWDGYERILQDALEQLMTRYRLTKLTVEVVNVSPQED